MVMGFGRPACRRRARRLAAGFTLIEVMVALVIVALVGTGLSLSLGAMRGRDAEREVERLRLVLEAVAERAVVRGQAISVNFMADGYRFSVFDTDGTWRPLDDPPVFAERVWPDALSLHALIVEGEDRLASPRLVFGSAIPEFELALGTPSGGVTLRGTVTGAVTRHAAQVER